MPKNLELIRHRKAIELQHDRWVKRSNVAVPDIARDASEVDGGEATLETACHRHFWNAVALPQILAQKARFRKRSLFARYSRSSALPVSAEISAASQKPKCCATSMRSKPVSVRMPTS